MSDALTVVFATHADAQGQAAHVGRSCFFVPVPEPPPEAQQGVTLFLQGPGAAQMSCDARVLQVLPGAGMAVAFEDTDVVLGAFEQFLTQVLEGDETGEAATATWGKPDVRADGDGDLPLAERLKTMSTPDKRKLALHGDRPARQLMLKDPNKQMHVFVVQNKGITLDEVRYVAGFRQANPEALKQISENRDWVQNPRILMALVQNPKTPPSVATRLLSKLGTNELRRLAKSSNVPRAVSIAARKLVTG